jgi:hypothetical protein
VGKSKRKWVSVFAIAGVAAASLMGSTGSAQASPAHARPASCSDPSYSPSTVNLGLSPVVETFHVTADCDGGLAGWEVYIPDLYIYVYDGAPQETFTPSQQTDSDAGAYSTQLTTDDANYNQNEFLSTFHLKRYDTWGNTFNASPEPVKKGATIKFYGELLRANWDQGKYYGYGNGYTHLDFRPAGNPAWKTVKTFRTSTTSPGYISGLTAAATVSGFWRVYYTGNDYGSPALSKTDYVEVD